MKHKVICAAIYGVLLLVVAGGSYVWGLIEGMKNAHVMEFKMCDAAISYFNQYPEARQKIGASDFLKARYYHLANWIPDDYLGSPRDWGPVDFGQWSVPFSKDPMPVQEEYERFKQRTVRSGQPGRQATLVSD